MFHPASLRHGIVVMALGVALAASGALAGGPAPALAASATPTVLASDSFSRGVTDAWGQADTGGTYSLFGTRADYDVASGLGSMRLTAPRTTRRAILGNIIARDVDLSVRVKVNRLPARGGSGQYAYLVARHQAGGAEEQAHMRVGSDGNVYMGAGHTTDGTVASATPLRTEFRVPGLVATPNTWFRLRLQVVGANPTTLRMRLWREGGTEPQTWPFVATDNRAALQRAGSIGLMAYVSLPAANAPVMFSFDDLRAADATPSTAGDWPQFRHDLGHSGNNTAETTLSPSTVAGLTLAWTGMEPGHHVHSSPVVANGVVYVGSDDGKLYAFAVGCGTGGAACSPLWTGATGAGITSSAAVVGGRVYVGSDDGKLYAFAVGCGTGGAACSPLWTGATGAGITSSPAVSDGVAYIASWDGKLYAFAVGCGTGGATCSPLWTGPTGGPILGSPAVSDGVVYIGSRDAKLYAFAVGCGTGGATCSPVWTGMTHGDISFGSPTVSDGVVYVLSTNDGHLYAFAVGCGSGGAACDPLWTGSTSFGLSTPAVADGVVYVSSTDEGRLLAFPVGCGTGGAACSPIWRGTVADGSQSSPAVANGVVYAGSFDGRLLAFAVGCATGGATCGPIWSGAAGGRQLTSSPAVVDGTVYIGAASGTYGLYAYALPGH